MGDADDGNGGYCDSGDVGGDETTVVMTSVITTVVSVLADDGQYIHGDVS